MNDKIKGIKSLLFDISEKDGGNVSARTAFNAMKRGDDWGREIVDSYIGYLAEGITNMVNIFQPEVVSLGGGVSNEGDYLLDLLMPRIRERVYGGNIVLATKICVAKLGNNAGIIGAAML